MTDPLDGPPVADPAPTSGDGAARLAEENARLQQELNSLREEASGSKRERRGRARSIVFGVLVVLTSIAIVATLVAVWTQRTLASEDRYVSLVAPLAEDPAVTDALAVRLTDDVFTALDVEDRVRTALASIPELPDAAVFLAGPITSAAHNLVESRVQTFLTSDTFADLWVELNRVAHAKVVALLNGDYDELPNVSVNGGDVQLNLVAVVAQVVEQVAQAGVDALGIDVTIPSIPADLDASAAADRLGSALGVNLPDGFGQVTIMSADQLRGYQDTVRTLKRLIGVLVLVSLVLLAATLLVARDRRRAVIWLSAGVVVALLLGGVLLRRIESRVVDAIARPGARAAAQDVLDEVQASLRSSGLTVLVIAAVTGVAAYLLGRPPWLKRAWTWARSGSADGREGSQLESWVAGHADAVRLGGIALGVVVLFVTGIDWLPVVIVAVFVALLWWWVGMAERRSLQPRPVAE